MASLNTILENINYATDNRYVLALLLFVFFIVLIKFLLFIIKKVLSKIVKRTRTTIDDEILSRSEKPVFITLVFWAFQVSIVPLGLSERNAMILNGITSSILIILVTYTVYMITAVFVEHYVKKINHETRASFHSELIPFANNFSKIIFAIIAFIFILRVWGVNIGPLLTGLGIAGITVGLSLQNTLLNIIGGISLLLDKNFNIGDEIKIDGSDVEGAILDVGLRSTKIRTKNNELVIIPNSVLANSRIINYAKPTTHLKIQIDFIVSYGENIERIQKLIIDKTKDVEFIYAKTKPEVNIANIEGKKIKLKANFWINLSQIQVHGAKEKLSLMIYDILKSHKIKVE